MQISHTSRKLDGWGLVALIVVLPLALPDPRSTATIFDRAREVGHLQVLYSGTSITCGTGVGSAHAFPALLEPRLQELSGVKVQTTNICFAGSLSITQLASLKEEGPPSKPDLLILESGTSDQLGPEGSPAALEGIFRLARSQRIPVIALYPWTEYTAMPKAVVSELAKRYSIPLVDIHAAAQAHNLKIADITPDRCHPNERGHQLISDALLNVLSNRFRLQEQLSAVLPERKYKLNLDSVRFVPASAVFPGEPHPLNRFITAGSGRACYKDCDWSFTTNSSTMVLIFSYGKVPTAFSYQIDDEKPRSLEHPPAWLLNYPLFVKTQKKLHRIRIRLQSSGRPVALDGFLVVE